MNTRSDVESRKIQSVRMKTEQLSQIKINMGEADRGKLTEH
jgi:hypothetical protein